MNGKPSTLTVFLAHPLAVVPQYATDFSSGLDLVSVEEVTIEPGKRAMISTGLKVEIPRGCEGQVRPRSGLSVKHGITVLNTPGTVDSDYRGEIKVILLNTSSEQFRVETGMRIAQLVIAPIAKVNVISVNNEEQLTSTGRGVGGFGSTGTK